MADTNKLVHHVNISNLKLKMINLNHSIYSPYKTLVENQNLYIYFEIYCNFLGKKKIVTIGRSQILKSSNFLLVQKIEKKIKKYEI
jgi:hypothetical protein